MAKKAPEVPAVKTIDTDPPRLPNAYVPNEKVVKRDPNKSDVIRMWKGGEHRRAFELAVALKLNDADRAEVIGACDGIRDLGRL